MDKFSHSSIHDIIVSSIMSVQAAKFVASVFWPQTRDQYLQRLAADYWIKLFGSVYRNADASDWNNSGLDVGCERIQRLANQPCNSIDIVNQLSDWRNSKLFQEELLENINRYDRLWFVQK